MALTAVVTRSRAILRVPHRGAVRTAPCVWTSESHPRRCLLSTNMEDIHKPRVNMLVHCGHRRVDFLGSKHTAQTHGAVRTRLSHTAYVPRSRYYCSECHSFGFHMEDTGAKASTRRDMDMLVRCGHRAAGFLVSKRTAPFERRLSHGVLPSIALLLQ